MEKTLTKSDIVASLVVLIGAASALPDNLPSESKDMQEFLDLFNDLDDLLCRHLTPAISADEIVLAQVTERVRLKEGPYMPLIERLGNRFVRLSQLIAFDAPTVILEKDFFMCYDALGLLADKAGVEFPPHEPGS